MAGLTTAVPVTAPVTAPAANRDRGAGWLRRLVPFLRVRPASLIVAFVAVSLAGTAGAALLLVRRDLLNLALGGHLAAMRVPLVLLVGFGVLIYAAQRVAAYRELKAANEAQFLLYDAVHRRMLETDVGTQAVSMGQLAARLNTDIGTAARAVAALPKLAGVAVSTIATVVLMAVVDPLLGGLVLVMVPVLLLIVRASRRRVRPATWDAQQREADIAQLVNDCVTGIRVVKTFGQEEHEIGRMAVAATRLYTARMHLTRLKATFQPLLESMSGVVQVFVVVLGGWLVLRHQLTLGSFLAFTTYSGQLVGTVNWFADTVLELQEAGVCANRVLDLLDLPTAVAEDVDAEPLPPVRGDISVDGVRFAYPHGPTVLDGVRFDVRAGETLALVGVAGSGKSTILKLLMRFADPAEGTVRIDGHDIRSASIASVRGQVGAVFDEPMLLTGTIRDNIAFGRPGAADEAIHEAARIAGAHDFIVATPDGYDTPVGERGSTLSGGQRQRIVLARTLLIEPRILLLDDATGAVDASLERDIHRRLRDAAGDRTTVFVGYRAATVASADRIVVLDAGRVVDEGSHAELFDRCEHYRRLIDPTVAAQDIVRTDPGPLASIGPTIGPTTATALPITGPAVTGRVDDMPFSVPRMLRPYAGALLLMLTLILTSTAAGVLGPAITREAVDSGILAGSMTGLARAALAILAITALGLLLGPATLLLSGRTGQRVVAALRLRMWRKLIGLPIAYFERQKTGRLLTRMINDVEGFADMVSTDLVGAVISVFTLVGVLIAMLLVSPLLAGLMVAMVVPFIVMLVVFNRRIVAAYTMSREQVAEANSALQENLTSMREAQAFGQQSRQHAQYSMLIRRYLDSRLKAERLIATTFPVTSFLNGTASALVLGVGAVMLARGAISAGELIAFVLWVNVFFNPLLQLSSFYATWKRVQVSTGRIRELLGEEADPAAAIEQPIAAEDLSGEVRVEGVGFRYPGSRRDALGDLDLIVPAGSTVALVGDTGAGKSTIFKLLARFYDPTVGRILIGGADLRTIEVNGFRRRLGYVPQEPFLFGGSIRDNIAYGRPHATDAEIESAALAVGAHPGISGLPDGYGQRIGERGVGLSAGLRQLVCLARAYLLDPSIVLLDEATANLDLHTEARVLAAMRALSRGRTTVLIAHRIQTAMTADRIAVVQAGRIVEYGTHDELVRSDGRYRELYDASIAGTLAALVGGQVGTVCDHKARPVRFIGT